MRWSERWREESTILIRLIVGFHLVYGTMDNVFSLERMAEFQNFIASTGFPFPAGAWISAWGQFLSGFAFILGVLTRPAAALMVVNFLFALGIAHRTGGYPPAALAFLMLFSSAFLLLHGPGPWSVDAMLARRREARAHRPAGIVP